MPCRRKLLAPQKSSRRADRGYSTSYTLTMDEKLRASVAAAEKASSKEEALAIATEYLIPRLATIMEANKLPGVAAKIEALKTSGLDSLLVEGVVLGRVTAPMARDHIQRMLRALRDRAIGVDELKAGILVFDELARRVFIAVKLDGPFRYAAKPDGPFRYPDIANRARDLLIALAYSLHR
jgi:hypothetical protein